MKIAVCDKNQYFVQHFLAKIQATIEQHNSYNFEFEYLCYTNPEKLINDHKDNIFDIAFLDIEMPRINGLYVGDELFKVNESIFIIYVTSSSKSLISSLKHRVYRCVIKGDETELIDSIKQLLNDLATLRSRYIFTFKNTVYSLSVNSIVYFESCRNKIYIHTNNSIFEQMTTIKHLEETLPQVFCRCHASFIVNLNMVYEVKPDTIFLTNGEKLPLSRKYKIDIITRLTQFQ